MIFVTVGSAEKGIEFDRLITEMDAIAGRLKIPVTMQIGSSDYVPKNAAYFSYKGFEEMKRYFQQAKVIVGHCGSGTVLNAFQAGVPLIVVPRTRAQGEVDQDDHQALLAEKISKVRGVAVVYKVEDLEKSVCEMLNAPFAAGKFYELENRQNLFTCLRQFIRKNQGEPVCGKK